MNNVPMLLFAVWMFGASGASNAQEVKKSPLVLTWNYDAQQKRLTLHLANNSGKDITAYNISMAEKYTDGSTNPSYAEGIPHNIRDAQRMEDFLGLMITVQLSRDTPDEERMRREYGNGTFAAGTTRDQVILETKDISDVETIVNLVVYADRTLNVQNEQAFRQLLAVRKGQLLAMEKVNEITKRALADPTVSSPVSAAFTELTQLADSLDVKMKNHSLEDPEANQEMPLRGAVQSLRSMQRSQMGKPEAEQLKEYVAEQEKRIALMSPHCQLGVIVYQ